MRWDFVFQINRGTYTTHYYKTFLLTGSSVFYRMFFLVRMRILIVEDVKELVFFIMSEVTGLKRIYFTLRKFVSVVGTFLVPNSTDS